MDAGSVLAPWFDKPCRCNAAEIDDRSEDPLGGRINPGGGGVGGGDTCSTARQPSAITSITRHAPALAVTRAAICLVVLSRALGKPFQTRQSIGHCPEPRCEHEHTAGGLSGATFFTRIHPPWPSEDDPCGLMPHA